MQAPTQENIRVAQYLGFATMGGAEVYAALLANMHAETGQDSHVIVRAAPGPISSRFSDKVSVRYLHWTRASIRRRPFAFFGSLVKGFRLLNNAISRDGIQVLHTHLPDENLWGLVMSLTRKCRVVITIHNNKFFNDADGTRLGRVVVRAAYRMMLRHCAAVVACSDEVKQSYVENLNISPMDAKKIHVVNNGVPLPDPIQEEAKAAIRHQYRIGLDEIWVVAAGRLTEAKDFSTLLKAIGLLRERGLPLRVTIGGEGELRDHLEREVRDLGIEDQVDLPGNLNDLQGIMQAADMLAMPSLWEGLPLTLLEAMACELPIVGTRIKGLEDVVKQGEQGLLVPVRDPHALANALEQMAEDPETRRAMGVSARIVVEDRFSFQRVYDQLSEIYQQATSS